MIQLIIKYVLGIPDPVPGPLAVEKPAPDPVRKIEKATPGVYVIDEQTRTFGFVQVRPTEAKCPTLTDADIRLLENRGYKNVALNAKAKAMWATGATASEAANILNVSHDYAKKLFGTFSTAETSAK